jgi:hypothetical protein
VLGAKADNCSLPAAVIYTQPEMPGFEHHPRHAFAMVRDELMLDGNSRRNLALGEGVSQERSSRASIRARLCGREKEPIYVKDYELCHSWKTEKVSLSIDQGTIAFAF